MAAAYELKNKMTATILKNKALIISSWYLTVTHETTAN
ncbi:MAG: hypothetical protein ACJA2G_000949 [Cognaticolwellia sp.]|jgi:hypothetical protein